MVQIHNSKKSGFTLIELSIVLVIIGLIVGGVLVGQDLIKAAEIRATVSQIEKYDAAANTFRSKYNGYPGDLLNPANYSLTATGIAADGDNIIERTDNTDGTSYDKEAAAFFKHLNEAGMSAESMAETDFAIGSIDDITTVTPLARIGRGVRIFVYADAGLNYYALTSATATDGVLTVSATAEMPVITAFQIDTKIDDGLPSTGRARAVTDLNTADAGATATDGECVDDTGTDLYNMATTARANATLCSMRMRTSF